MITVTYETPFRGPKRRGATKYPWRQLQVGESFSVLAPNLGSLYVLASRTGKKLGRTFSVSAGYPGKMARVTRKA